MKKAYKQLYLKEKSEKGLYKDSFNALIEELKRFKHLKVEDKIVQSSFNCDNLRAIKIYQDNNHHLEMLLNEELYNRFGE